MQWLKTRWAALGSLGGMFLACGALALLKKLGLASSFADVLAFVIMFTTIAVNGLAILTIHSDVDALRVNLPVRMFRLPVSTWKLVMGLMLFGVVEVGITSAITAYTVQGVLGVAFTWWLPPLFGAVLIAFLMAWSYAQQEGNPEFAVVSLLVVAVIAVALRRIDILGAFVEQIPSGVTAALTCLAAFGLGVWTFSLNRHNRLPQWRSLRSRPGASGSNVLVARRFNGRMRAQIWYEWRRYGWQLPASVVVLLVCYFLVMPLFGSAFVSNEKVESSLPALDPDYLSGVAIDWLQSVQFLTTGMQVAASVAAVVVGGFMFMKAGYWNARSTYLLTRPMRTADLAWARLVTLFVSAIMGLAILMVIFAGLVFIAERSGSELGVVAFMQMGYEDLPGWFLLSFFWGSLFLVMWVAIWPLNVGVAFMAFIVAYLPPLSVIWFLRSNRTMGYTEANEAIDKVSAVAAWPAAAILGAAFLWVLWGSWRLNLVRIRTIIFAVVCWGISGVAFYVYVDAHHYMPGANIGPNQFELYPVRWALWLALSLLPVAPLFSLPYMLEKARRQ